MIRGGDLLVLRGDASAPCAIARVTFDDCYSVWWRSVAQVSVQIGWRTQCADSSKLQLGCGRGIRGIRRATTSSSRRRRAWWCWCSLQCCARWWLHSHSRCRLRYCASGSFQMLSVMTISMMVWRRRRQARPGGRGWQSDGGRWGEGELHDGYGEGVEMGKDGRGVRVQKLTGIQGRYRTAWTFETRRGWCHRWRVYRWRCNDGRYVQWRTGAYSMYRPCV